jgi:hypothetical protein
LFESCEVMFALGLDLNLLTLRFNDFEMVSRHIEGVVQAQMFWESLVAGVTLYR